MHQENRHIDTDTVLAAKIKSQSLNSINFAPDSIDAARIKDGEVKNADIEDNVL